MNEYIVDNKVNTLQKHTAKTFGWVFLGIMTSAIAAYLTIETGLYITIFSSNMLYFGIIIAELVTVFVLVGRLNKLSYISAICLFFAYSILTGITLSIMLLAYTAQSVVLALGFTAFLFFDLAFIGMTTKVDLSKYTTLLFVGLIMLIIISFAGFFMDLSTMEVGICFMGITIFLGITAYDTQNIKRLYYANVENKEALKKLSIYSALELYLDFINIFLYILRIIGRSNNK